MVRAADCVPVLLADEAGAGRRGRPLRSARPGRRDRAGHGGRDARPRRRHRSRPGSARRCAVAATRCREEMRTTWRRSSRTAARPRRGVRRPSTSPPGCAPSSSAPASTWSTSRAAPASRPTSSPTAATAAVRPAGRDRQDRAVSDRAPRGARRPASTPYAGRIAAAATAAGRDPAEVTLVAVTKFFPASDVRILADLGVTDVGENRHPEAADKRPSAPTSPLRWHFVGGLQSNKAAVGRLLRRRRGVGRPDQAGLRPRPRCPRARPRRRRPAPGEPRPARPRRPLGCRRRRPAGAGRRGRRRRHARAARPDGGGAARRGPARGLRPAGRDPRRLPSPNTRTPPGSRPG